MFFILLLALCITFETAAPKTFEIVYKEKLVTFPDRCRRLNGRLARIENAEDQKEVELFLAKYRGVYSVIVDGVSDGGSKSKNFYYSDGTPIKYANWYPGEPNNSGSDENCIELYVQWRGPIGKWNSIPCVYPGAALCEVPTTTRTTTSSLITTTPSKTFVIVSKDWLTMTYRNWQYRCRTVYGRLARIENAEDQKEVELLLVKQRSVYSVLVDGHRGKGSKSKNFYYSDGTPIKYANWRWGEPNNSGSDENCIELYVKWGARIGKWIDIPCGWPDVAICEIPTTTTTTSSSTTTTPSTTTTLPTTTTTTTTPPKTFKIVYYDWSVKLPDKCRRLNGRLARIENAEDQRAAEAYLAKYRVHSVLVDGHRGNGTKMKTFYYADGTPIRYTNWYYGEPNDSGYWVEDCIELYVKWRARFGKWNDVPCVVPLSALCEILTTTTTTSSSTSTTPSTTTTLSTTTTTTLSSTTTTPTTTTPSTTTTPPKTFKIVNKDRTRMFYSHWVKRCRRVNGRLARIENAEDQRAAEAVLAKYPKLHSVIVDGHRGNGSKSKNFYYSDGTPIKYANWKSGEPGSEEKCIEVYMMWRRNFGKWNDVGCWTSWDALCEVPTTTTTTTTLPTTTTTTSSSTMTPPPKTFKIVYYDWSAKLPDKCHRLNGRLARIENAEKQRAAELFLAKYPGVHSVLVDGHRGNGSYWKKFYFADGTPINYTNWDYGEPNNSGYWEEDCIELYVKWRARIGKWNDVPCVVPLSALCEI